MVEPIYVPVLPARRDAWNAYAELDVCVRRRIAPLWTLVPHAGRERTHELRRAPTRHGRSPVSRPEGECAAGCHT